MMLLHPRDDLRSVERTGIGLGRLCQAQHTACVFLCAPGQYIGLPAKAGYLDSRPFAPQVDSGRRLDKIRNKSSANSRCDLEEVEPAILMGADVFGVRYTVRHAEVRRKSGIQGG